MKTLSDYTKAKRSYNSIMRELYKPSVIEKSNEATANWNIADMVAESNSLLKTYFDENHANSLIDPFNWEYETGRLKRFIKKWSAIAKKYECQSEHWL